MSIAKLAKIANVSPTTIGDIERGKRQPREKTAENLARALGISIEELADHKYGAAS